MALFTTYQLKGEAVKQYTRILLYTKLSLVAAIRLAKLRLWSDMQ